MDNNHPQCSLCDEDDLHYAVVYCEDDNQNYCRKHFDSHALFPSTRGHKTHDLLNTQGKSICDHLSEQSVYCNEHELFCCLPCKVFAHQDCECVNNVNEILKQKESVEKRCRDMHRKMKGRKSVVDKKSAAAHDQEDKWISKVNGAVNKMNEVKAELEKKINNKIDYVRQIMNKKRESLDNEQAQLQNAIVELENILGRMAHDQPKLETFKTLYKAEMNLKSYEPILRTRPGNCHIEFLKAEHNFEAAHYVNGTLQCFTQAVEEINKVYSEIQKYLPHIKEEGSEDSVGMLPFISMETGSIQTARKLHCDETDRKGLLKMRTRSRSLDCSSGHSSGFSQERKRRLSDCYESLISHSEKDTYPSIPMQTQCVMKVSVPGDKPDEKCCITGLAPIENNTYVIMADNRNSKLKLFGSCGGLEDEMRFEAVPRDIAKIDDSTILVNFPMAKNIQIVKIENDKNTCKKKFMIGGTKIHTDAKCCGIAFHKDHIYVATQIPHQIIIMTLQGTIVRKIPGDGLFDRATYLSVDPDSSLIYISDPSKKCVFGINEDREVLMKYNVEASHGIVCAGNQKIFIADWESGVHLIGTDGVRNGDLRLDRCFCPQKLAFDSRQSILYVTEWECDVIRKICLGSYN